MSNPAVSVVLICYNTAAYLAEAIESVRAQTFTDWELLLVDDGSTDGSAQIAESYAARDPDRIRALFHPDRVNRGKSTSRNLGIQEARGEYLCFLDSDDVFMPDRLEHQVGLLAAHPEAGMVYGPTFYWHSWTNRPEDATRERINKLGVAPGLYRPPALAALHVRHGWTVPCVCAMTIRTDLVRRLGAFDEQIQDVFEDQVLLAKLCLAQPVLVTDSYGEKYRQHAASTSMQAIAAGTYHPTRPNVSQLRYLRWLEDYAASQGITDTDFAAALRRAFRPYRQPVLDTVLRALRHVRHVANKLLKRRVQFSAY